MNVPTGNVVIGFNREVMEKLFSQGASYTNLLEGISGESDALLFNHDNNPNFIEFTHDCTGKANIFKLSLIDPFGEFERRFMMHNTVLTAAQHLKKQSSKKNKSPKKMLDEMKHEDETSKRESTHELQSKMRAAFQKAEGTRLLYIAYGVGTNLELWSGPHMVQLSNASIQVESPKKISLEFIPIPMGLDIGTRQGAYGEQVNINLHGLTMEINARSERFDFLNYQTDKRVYAEKQIQTLESAGFGSTAEQSEFEEMLSKTNQGHLIGVFKEVDFHMLITDIIRQIIAQACGTKNVIVLLPDINLICRDAIDEITLLERLSKDLKESKTGEKPKGPTYLAYLEKVGLYGTDDPFCKFYATIMAVVHKFCLSWNMELKDTEKEKTTFSPPTLQFLMDQDAAAEFSGRVKKFLTQNDFFACHTISSKEGFPEPTKALDNISNFVSQCSRGKYNSVIDYFYESDSNVIKIWAEAGTKGKAASKALPLFAGIDTDLDPKEPVIVYGDIGLIKSYLYAGADMNQKNASVSDLKSKANSAEADKAAIIEGHETLAAQEYAAFGVEWTGDFTGPNIQTNQSVIDTAEDLVFEDIETQQFAAATFAKIIEEGEKKAEEMPTEGDYLAAAAEIVPLHPYDKQVLTDKEYNELVREVIYPKIKNRIGPYGDVSYVPDDFSYGQEMDEGAKEKIQNSGIPIFRYNTNHPNILDLKFNFGALYYSQLMAGVTKEVNRRASASLAGAWPNKYTDFEFGDSASVIAYIRTRHFALGDGTEAEKQIKKEIAHQFQGGTGAFPVAEDAEKQAEMAYQMYEETLKNPDKPYIKIDQLLPGNPVTVMSDFIEQMHGQSLQIDIETLPMMHLSKISTLNTPCLLFAQTGDVIQTQQKKKSGMNSFYSGDYLILGFKHQISSSKSSSNFNLMASTPKMEIEEEEDSVLDQWGPEFEVDYSGKGSDKIAGMKGEDTQ